VLRRRDPDGKTAVAGNFDNKITLWDVASGASFGSLDHADWLQTVVFFARWLGTRFRCQ
jgi:WD40 repeat protein